MTERSINVMLEVGYEFTYVVESWGHPGTAPSLSHPGDPPEGPEVEITGATDEDGDVYEWEDFDDTEKAKVLEAIYEELAETDYDQDYD